MEREVVEIRQNPVIIEYRKRVAAYARVSSPKDTMLHSLATQIAYYRQLILSTPGWVFSGIYADEGRTGTKENRPQFQALLQKCRSGDVDMVITKSISRMARNTVTLLNTVRELKALGVDVYFEEQNIHTISSEGEVLLTLLASFAQAESLEVSENCKWRIRHKFQEGYATPFSMIGYRINNGEITVIPEEAQTVRRIFDLYLDGNGLTKIANTLNDKGYRTVHGKPWRVCTVARVLDNEKYSGDLHLQRFFSSDHISKTKVRNTGELPSYIIENDHEAIIEKDCFQKVAEERKRRSTNPGKRSPVSVLTRKVRCPYCGKNYCRKTTTGGVKWCCSTYNTKGKKHCPQAKMVPEETLLNTICSVLDETEFNETSFEKRVDYIEACCGNILRFHLTSGETADYTWCDRSRADSWTPQRRLIAASHGKQRLEHGK